MPKNSPPLLRLAEQRRAGAIGRDRQIFCNRDLNFAETQWVGFDMDYTLAIYNRVPFDQLAHELTLRRLVEDYRYPQDILEIPFDPHFAIRGLVIDRKLGHILKVDSFRFVGAAYHGLSPLPESVTEQYRTNPPRVSESRYRLIDTLFELPEAYLYAALVDYMDKHEASPDYARISDDVRAAIDRVHAAGVLKRSVTNDLAKYIEDDREIATMLHRLRSAGKKLFLMTNSYFEFTDRVMRFLLEDRNPSYSNWKNYFDVIVTGARKPSFFRGHDPFEVLDDKGKSVGREFHRFQRGVCYQHGNLRDFERMLGVGGDRILYIGDHIYGDILRSKIDSHWRTCMIIPEMEEEMQRAREGSSLLAAADAKERELQKIEDEMQWDAQVLNELRRERDGAEETAEWPAVYEDAYAEVGTRVDAHRKRRRQLLTELFELEQRFASGFHPRWGSLFKEGNEHSIFGEQVESYACVYTSRASNFFHTSPTRYFRSPRNMLPHEKVSG